MRSKALREIARAVRERGSAILEANSRDLEAGENSGLAAAMLDRLRLDDSRLDSVAGAVESVAEMPDLVGQVVHRETRPNGLEVSRVRIPLGVVAMIFESRPNVTTDAAALCLRAGNAVILRGGKEAFHSNQALGAAVAQGLEVAGLPPAAVQVLDTTDRQAMVELLQLDELIDLVIPRGGEGLIRFVAEKSRIPVLKHYKGVCHLYVHQAADLEMAANIAVNAKAQRPGVCNALETLLVDRSVAPEFLPIVGDKLRAAGVELRGDQAALEHLGQPATAATEDDWSAEYLDKILAVRVVADFDEAVGHIERYGSDHTESIITQDQEVAEHFLRVVNSSTVMVNASTRFADGGELGLGAEIGISTTKLHAFGPMGAEGLTTTKFVVKGDGQLRT